MIIYAILGPPLLALFLAWLQNLYYAARVRSGSLADEDRPFFGILVFRGLLVALGIVLLITVSMKRLTPETEDDPMVNPEMRDAVIERKYGAQDEASQVRGSQDEALQQAIEPDAVEPQGDAGPPPAE